MRSFFFVMPFSSSTYSHSYCLLHSGVGMEVDSKCCALLMERVCWTLERQIRMWKMKKRSVLSNTRPLCGGPLFMRRSIESNFLIHRLEMACQLADVMVYLHKKRFVNKYVLLVYDM